SRGIPCGDGNVVSIKLSLLYRWHAAVSEPEEWTEKLFVESMKGVDMKTVGHFLDFSTFGMNPGPDVKKWTFGGANGRFADADVARILQNVRAPPAHAFGARGTPEVLHVVELFGTEQGRG
ncbi:hypothetical protein EDB84DRAFT_1606568, partial [Lactarius hengduanensis]